VAKKVAERSPATRVGNGVGKGPARGYSWPAFEVGNRAAVRHGVYLTKFGEGERGEIEEIAESLRAAATCLFYSPAFEPLIQMAAARIWRWRRGYAYLAEHGEEASAAVLRDLNVLERSLQRDLADLGVNPRSAAELGVDLVRLAAATEEEFDLGRLSQSERRTLSALLAKGSGDD
jgi:hypothetical protein